MKPCIGIPIYEHGQTIGEVLGSLEPYGLACIIVDDGNSPATREVIVELASRYRWVEVVHHESNRGRGAALRTLYRAAADRGYSHVVQIDADGQHDANDIPRFLDAARRSPKAVVLGSPVFDQSAPFHRVYGRKLSQAIVWLQTLSFSVQDPLCGFRCIPLARTLAILENVQTGNRMDFDPEIVIRLVRSGCVVVNVSTNVIYPVDGVSHFRMIADNALIAWRYLRLATTWRSGFRETANASWSRK